MDSLGVTDSGDNEDKSPESVYFQRLKDVEDSYEAVSSALIVGIQRDNENKNDKKDGNEGKEKMLNNEKEPYSQADLGTLRYFLITKNRQTMFNNAMDFVTRGHIIMTVLS